MESYSIEMNHLPLEDRAKLNYDAPHAIDMHLLEPRGSGELGLAPRSKVDRVEHNTK